MLLASTLDVVRILVLLTQIFVGPSYREKKIVRLVAVIYM